MGIIIIMVSYLSAAINSSVFLRHANTVVMSGPEKTMKK